MSTDDDDWFTCPVCGEVVKADALACPACGADDDTGWSEDAEYDGLDLDEPDQQAEDRKKKILNFQILVLSIIALLLFLARVFKIV